MHASVSSVFYEFSKQFEGEIPFMYLDVKSLVTIGIGNLIDPFSAMPAWLKTQFWHKGDHRAATITEVEDEWKLVKSLTSLSHKLATRKGSFIDKTDLRIDGAAVSRLVGERLAANERFLKGLKFFKDFDKWPADAQLGVLSMAWAMGAGFALVKSKQTHAEIWKDFREACEKQDWATAAQRCHMSEAGNPGLIKRNAADKLLFENAERVKQDGADFGYKIEVLYFPTVLIAPVVITA
jgi:GH24 family phage-related lysozyme (muramidase)